MSKPQKLGIEGGKVVFAVNGRSYTTSKLTTKDLATMTVKQAQGLVSSGDADEVPYLKQFPWVF